MAGPPPDDPRDPVDPTEPVDPVDPVDETVVRDEWGEETVVADPAAYEPVEHYEEVEEVEEPPRRLPPTIWPWLLALLVFVLGLLGALYYLSNRDDGKGSTTTSAKSAVPSVVGMREEPAKEAIRQAGFDPGSKEAAASKPKGVVISQSPEAGARLEQGGSVILTVSKGPSAEQVPDVVGQKSEEALADLKAAGFDAKVTQEYSDKPAGVIVKQDPAGGSKLKPGGQVALVASKGAEPADVPSVVGQRASEATATLRDAGFETNLVKVPSSEAAGTVVAQSPAAGESAPKGSSVRINVAEGGSSGGGGATTSGGSTTTQQTTTQQTTTQKTTTQAQPSTTTVPDVVGQELADAARSFGQADLKVAVQPVPSDRPKGEVVAQAQDPGTELNRGETVQINVSKGPDPAPDTGVPNVVGETQERGRQRLVDASFETLSIQIATSDATKVGKVISQTPAARANIPQGFLVIMYVGKKA